MNYAGVLFSSIHDKNESLAKFAPSWGSRDYPIRQCSVYHSFNLDVVRTNWILVKGDELMKQRIEAATGDQGL